MNSVTFVLCLLVLGAHSLLVFGVECNVDRRKVKAGQKHAPKGQVSALACAPDASLKPCKKTEGDLSQPFPACCSHFEDC